MHLAHALPATPAGPECAAPRGRRHAWGWLALAAAQIGCDYGVCTKVRHGDKNVVIQLPAISVAGRNVVLMDDVASSGHTLAEACKLLLAAGAASVDVAVTHALFAGDALAGRAPLSIAGHKLILHALADGTTSECARQIEAVLARALDSEDYREGVAAFAGKRAPRFRGR